MGELEEEDVKTQEPEKVVAPSVPPIPRYSRSDSATRKELMEQINELRYRIGMFILALDRLLNFYKFLKYLSKIN